MSLTDEDWKRIRQNVMESEALFRADPIKFYEKRLKQDIEELDGYMDRLVNVGCNDVDIHYMVSIWDSLTHALKESKRLNTNLTK